MSEIILNSSLDKRPASFYRRFLFEEMARRKERNPQYSLRAFARSLDTDAAALSRIMNGKKTISFKMADKIIHALGLAGSDVQKFLNSVVREQQSKTIDSVSMVDADHVLERATRELDETIFRVISDWYHYAILELTFVKSFRSDLTWIARSVGISANECKQAVDRLRKVGLLRMVSGRYRKISVPITTKDKSKTSDAHKQHQQQMLEKSIASLQSDPINIRSHTGMTIPIDPIKLPEAKRMIQAFSNDLCRFLAAGEKTTVYQLSISLFPLQKDVSNEISTETDSCHYRDK